MDLSSELVALLGVAVGAGLSWGSGALTDRSRFRREQQVRWREQRLSTYANFSAAAKQTMSLLFRVGAHLKVDQQSEPMSLDEAKPLLAAAFHAREQEFERVRMVGSPEIVEAARTWVREIYTMRALIEAGTNDVAEWRGQVASTNRARDGFYEVARAEIGLGMV